MEFIIPEPLLTPKDVAKMCNVGVEVLRYWRAKRKGPSYIKLGCVRYRKEDVERWLAANRVETKDDKVIGWGTNLSATS